MNENMFLDKIRKLKKILQVLDGCIIKERRYPEVFYMPCAYKINNEIPPITAMRPWQKDELWAEQGDSHAWFCAHISRPNTWVGGRVELAVDSDWTYANGANPQFLLYVNGKIHQGLDAYHRCAVLTEAESDIAIYAYVGERVRNVSFRLSLTWVDASIEELYYNMRVPFDSLSTLHHNTKEYADIVEHLDRGALLLDMRAVPSENFCRSVEVANTYFREKFYGKLCRKTDVSVVGIGHTHIDCAWLWRLRQTREKVQRTFATVLELMRRYPEYKFMSSQALLYKYLKEEAPELYAEVKERIKEGRWEVEGSMWVEADCNLSSGESLVRQIVYGKRFFRNEFGVETRVLWLPDVFGYSACLPQILRKANVDWFLTSKISWNEGNTMPYDTFLWKGIDGTAIPTYFLTAQDKGVGNDFVRYATYIGNAHPPMLAGTWNRYQQKNLNNEVLLTFGWGDGGGGPTAEMIEELRRESYGIPGLPTAKIEFAGDVLKRIQKRIDENPALPTWRGELYLEFHRGTYTSQAKNKRNNRKSEFLFQNIEMLAQRNAVLLGAQYPEAELDAAWEVILTNQFHDIIPGSSIHEVYEDSDADYAALFRKGDALLNSALELVVKNVATDKEFLIFNPHSFAHSGEVKLNGVTHYVENIPAKGYAACDTPTTKSRVKIGDHRVETPFLRVRFDECWQLASVYDKRRHRELLSGKANVLEIYEDFPYQYDAWELSYYHKEKVYPITDVQSVEIVEDGCRRGIRILRKHMESTITQTIWFRDHSARIDFETDCDWQQTHQLLKAAFPVNINSERAVYEIQFGAVERPTHYNTGWDKMKFEVCAQKYADLSEGDYGVSLINDCKYGHDIHDGVMRISLLKCATHPDPTADKGHHAFTYALYPHEGDWQASDVVKVAYDLNMPLVASPAMQGSGMLPESYSFLTIDAPNVIAETVKRAQDSDDTVIRIYEAKNRTTKATLTFGFSVKEAWLCDLEENPIRRCKPINNKLSITISPYEILTLKIVKG